MSGYNKPLTTKLSNNLSEKEKETLRNIGKQTAEENAEEIIAKAKSSEQVMLPAIKSNENINVPEAIMDRDVQGLELQKQFINISNATPELDKARAYHKSFTPIQKDEMLAAKKEIADIQSYNRSLGNGEVQTPIESVIENHSAINNAIKTNKGYLLGDDFEASAKLRSAQLPDRNLAASKEVRGMKKVLQSKTGSFEERLAASKNGTKYMESMAKSAEETFSKAGAEVVENTAKEATEQGLRGLMHSPIGRVAAGLGVTAFIVSNMNKSKGQQSNAQLYSQQMPYQ